MEQEYSRNLCQGPTCSIHGPNPPAACHRHRWLLLLQLVVGTASSGHCQAQPAATQGHQQSSAVMVGLMAGSGQPCTAQTTDWPAAQMDCVCALTRADGRLRHMRPLQPSCCFLSTYIALVLLGKRVGRRLPAGPSSSTPLLAHALFAADAPLTAQQALDERSWVSRLWTRTCHSGFANRHAKSESRHATCASHCIHGTLLATQHTRLSHPSLCPDLLPPSSCSPARPQSRD
jgi:hypothetical protein